MDSRTPRPSKAKAKSGCRTCKIRKVKCDEGRPACQRCVSTGRVCDGYGIWGGGGNYYGNRQPQNAPSSKDCSSSIITRPPAPFSVLVTGTEDTSYFEWFTHRTAPKLPGSFISGFWTTLLFQASLNEPAILHAVLALSAVHKGGITNSADDQEQITLQHYVKAIKHLRPHFELKDRASSRVALITCVVFVYVEFLRGHLKTAQLHLLSGLKVLQQMGVLSTGDDGVLGFQASRESTDDWIISAFSRLHLQVELFKYTYQHPRLVSQGPGRDYLILQTSGPEHPARGFSSINDAWHQLERLLNQIFHLNHQARQHAAPTIEALQLPPTLLESQVYIQMELTQWHHKHESFSNKARSADEEKVYRILQFYHTMATIMAATCLRPHDELVFDVQTPLFRLLLQQATRLGPGFPWPKPLLSLPGHSVNMTSTIIDVGWIPPLYYTAIKCRVHPLRLRAIRLLEQTSHREGLWDCITAACVTRKIMEVEERGFYDGMVIGDEAEILSGLDGRDFELPILPEEHRLRELEVSLEGSPMDKILVFCRGRKGEGDERVLVSEYDVSLGRWRDEDGW
ncbi:uncharacterized protein BDZ99DRAFT_448691 [Mytilinidion resinicola]|uniref:Zn(2)-C6 fungal-type domain-containing protein n=1 Tax=Mytilinidion resinicola TaxID=574789 RepID=A0A6A6YDU7_9PEZI|nr:uncharacterized protein BDZ99DRAFT_448691 [Mytilinidion resinicola]KAF2807002.1 hypothetical protein BDZ99DRAFT_448691 [Mytilinidion resinicola]